MKLPQVSIGFRSGVAGDPPDGRLMLSTCQRNAYRGRYHGDVVEGSREENEEPAVTQSS